MTTGSTDYSFRFQDCLLGAQMLFVAFGALVLAPLLTGLDPNVALFTAGAGTLLFQVITKGKVPVFLASSFAFIAPIIYGAQTWGIPQTLSGLAAAGLVYVLLAGLIRWRGVGVLHRLLPPVVTGPVIMVIGLILAKVAVFMAVGKTGDGSAELFPRADALTVSMISLVATIAASLLGRGILKLIPILVGIVAGYTVSFFLGIEHFGDILAISSVTGKNFLKDPGVHRTMLGDGLATTLASCLGGPPNTTYSEVTGAVALTRAFNPAIMTWAAITAILLAFVGKLGACLQSIPAPVMGGIMILLFGAITVVGINTLVRAGEDLMQARNLAIVAVILVFGIGGMSFGISEVTISGIGLAGITGVVLNLILPNPKE